MLSRSDILELLRTGGVEFVVADVGELLQWVDSHDCFNFWKDEVKPHLVEADSRIELDKFAGGYCYMASEWEDDEIGSSIVLLERHH
jgi:hypothetical protein